MDWGKRRGAHILGDGRRVVVEVSVVAVEFERRSIMVCGRTHFSGHVSGILQPEAISAKRHSTHSQIYRFN
jgi:hypothetical protein